MTIKSSWNGSWTRILPSREGRMVPGPGYCNREQLEWFLDQDIAIKCGWNGSWSRICSWKTRILPSNVAGMVPGPGYCHQE